MLGTAILLIMAMTGFGAAQPMDCRFPGSSQECRAPNSGAAVEWREATASHGHELWLRDHGTIERLLTFNRYVDVLWSPDGAAIAITDYAGSNEADVWVFRLQSPGQRANVEEAFIRAFGRPPEVYQNGHRYFVAQRWRSATSLTFSVRAYDAEPGREYEAMFQYDLDGLVRRIEIH